MPTVLNIIEKSKKGAAIASADSYIKAVETYILTSELNHQLEKLQINQTYTVDTLNHLVEIKGTKPISGSVTIGNNQSVSSSTLIINDYIVKYDGNDYTIVGQGKGLFVDKTSVEVEKTKTATITATIEPTQEITWRSLDTNIATVNNGVITGINLGKTTIEVASDDGVYKKTIDVEVTNLYLSSVVQVGDYVAYDAGVWTSTANHPTTQGEFGGYISGQNKGESVSYCNHVAKTTTLKGWRVLSKSGTTVSLVHAGHPECYFNDENYSSESVADLNNRATSEYLNSTYANSAHMLSHEDYLSVMGNDGETTNDLIYIGASGTTDANTWYWLSTVRSAKNLAIVSSKGKVDSSSGHQAGVRPVIVLKDKIKTTGKTKDVLGQDAWQLTIS